MNTVKNTSKKEKITKPFDLEQVCIMLSKNLNIPLEEKTSEEIFNYITEFKTYRSLINEKPQVGVNYFGKTNLFTLGYLGYQNNELLFKEDVGYFQEEIKEPQTRIITSEHIKNNKTELLFIEDEFRKIYLFRNIPGYLDYMYMEQKLFTKAIQNKKDPSIFENNKDIILKMKLVPNAPTYRSLYTSLQQLFKQESFYSLLEKEYTNLKQKIHLRERLHIKKEEDN